MLLLPTPVRQTAHGYSPELCKRSRPVPQIMNFVFPAFTLNPSSPWLLSISKASWHIPLGSQQWRSSAYRSSQGTPARNSCDKASSTMINSKGLNTDPWSTPTFTSNSLLKPSPTRSRLRALAYIPWTYRTIHSSTPSFLRARALTPLFGNGAGVHGTGKISGVLTKIGEFDIVLMYDISIARLIPIIKLTFFSWYIMLSLIVSICIIWNKDGEPKKTIKKTHFFFVVKLGIFCLEFGKNILFGIGNGAEFWSHIGWSRALRAHQINFRGTRSNAFYRSTKAI